MVTLLAVVLIVFLYVFIGNIISRSLAVIANDRFMDNALTIAIWPIITLPILAFLVSNRLINLTISAWSDYKRR